MAFSRKPIIAADGTFSSAGAIAWNTQIFGVEDAVSGGIPYFDSTTTEATSALLAANSLVIGGGAGAAPFTSANLTFGAATGEGLVFAAGTATTDVAALSFTRTNNNAAVATGVKWTFTDTSSAAGFLPFQILGGSAGTTNLLRVNKAGVVSHANGSKTAPSITGLATGQGATSGIFFQGFENKGIGVASNGVAIMYLTATSGLEAVEAFGFTAENNSGSKPILRNTAPTIASGFGTSPSIVSSNGTAAFTVNVGTGGTASSGVITMPTATTGWAAKVENLTGVAANRGDQRTVVTATTTTSITVQNQTISTGAALAWTASDVLQIMALGY